MGEAGMNLWWYMMFVWIVGTMLAQVVEVGTGFTSARLAWPLLEGETQAAVDGGNWRPGGGRVYVGLEAIDYGGVADDCTGLPQQAQGGSCLTGLQRGQLGTDQGSYATGSLVRGSESAALEGITELTVVETDTLWDKITWPLATFGAIGKLVAEMGTADYSYLEGHGSWLRLLFHMSNFGMAIALVGLFAGPLSNLAGGVGRALTGRL